jgi:glycerol-3-phosphate acyltransferase PlsY
MGYLLGSIPNGLIIVKLTTGKDVRNIESGRTGGTNVMRAAGFWAGLATALLDMAKAALAVQLARWVFPGNHWLEIAAPIMAILGHNYSIFLASRDEDGKLHLHGGAGGAACVGGSLGLWPPSVLFILPMGLFFLFIVGYASLATISVALFSTLLFTYRAAVGPSPWVYAVFGVIASLLLTWELRDNIRRLLAGKERIVGLRAQRRGMKSNE